MFEIKIQTITSLHKSGHMFKMACETHETCAKLHLAPRRGHGAAHAALGWAGAHMHWAADGVRPGCSMGRARLLMGCVQAAPWGWRRGCTGRLLLSMNRV